MFIKRRREECSLVGERMLFVSKEGRKEGREDKNVLDFDPPNTAATS
jgi:hypothetical protein